MAAQYKEESGKRRRTSKKVSRVASAFGLLLPAEPFDFLSWGGAGGGRVKFNGSSASKLGSDLIMAVGLLATVTCSGNGAAGIGLVGGTAAGASPGSCSAGQSASVTQAGVSSVASG